MSEQILLCPSCKSSNLATLEMLQAKSFCEKITIEGPEYSGESEPYWDNSETVGVACNDCGWEKFSADWIKYLAYS